MAFLRGSEETNKSETEPTTSPRSYIRFTNNGRALDHYDQVGSAIVRLQSGHEIVRMYDFKGRTVAAAICLGLLHEMLSEIESHSEGEHPLLQRLGVELIDVPGESGE